MRHYVIRLYDQHTAAVYDEEVGREVGRFRICETPGLFDQEQGTESGWRWEVEAAEGSSGGGFFSAPRKGQK